MHVVSTDMVPIAYIYTDSGVSPSLTQSEKLVLYIPANVSGGNRRS